ncbi:hypothetical protein [Jatrophihabitans sp.]|uniref:hypothetical protein n=1 Tax=Jatrophihabitans sp. TaxID=1932789 RepID=UPI0030C6ADA4
MAKAAQPAPVVPPVRQPSEPTPIRDLVEPTIEQLLLAGKRSPKVAKLAEKITGDVARLRLRLNEERAAAEAKRKAEEASAAARAEMEKLEERLAELRSQVKVKRTPPASNRVAGAYPCPNCDRAFDTPQGRALHRRREHGYVKAAG